MSWLNGEMMRSEEEIRRWLDWLRKVRSLAVAKKADADIIFWIETVIYWLEWVLEEE